jgi:hypothetical protein
MIALAVLPPPRAAAVEDAGEDTAAAMSAR